MKPNTQTFIGCDAPFNEAKMVIFGAPFDSTTSFRPGTRFGPEMIRLDSNGLETYSPYLEKDLEEFSVMDLGNLDLPFGNSQKSLEIIEATAKTILDAKKIPFLIGGEHLVSLGGIRAAHNAFPAMVLLHFDAHADLRDDYMGEKLSHASVIRRAWDHLGDGKIYQFCIRSGAKEEFQWAKEHTHLETFNYRTLKDVADNLSDGTPVYVTIDLDVFDPSLFPGTGTPEVGGIQWWDMVKILQTIQPLRIIGADVVELSPHYDPTGVSTAVACKVIREMMLAIL